MGYVDGIINAQLNVYGYNFMEDSLDESFIEEFKQHMEWQLPSDYMDDARSMIADSSTMLPKIYKCSKINLEMASKNFKSGMTLRLFEIMCAGGFVIANYQTEIPDYLTINKDVVVYESIPDLLNKIDYYLTHDDERMEIAANGQKKVLEYHTYDIRVKQMPSFVYFQR